ncbi:TonB-dependent receptor domain-containing protein [Flavisolibacter tropicus]|uniref:TonB-dependent receptor n=1 Tax=Flavisolibacter tropicus TaxID=1492898 RepID=A0A172TV00_9BACT|nr:TonB-dependent receptor [Flavisolibacter tropicus]ANE50816.1 TonB-dependent receptor [Flavisolibacter tropicus]
MKKLLMSLVAVVAFATLNAQSVTPKNITGIVKDSLTQQPLPQATVALLEGTRSLANTQSTETGSFTLSTITPGNYTLTISSVGYEKKSMPITVKSDNTTIDLGTIWLITEGKQLSGVTVTAEKALLEDKGDRLIYNAEKDASNAGGTAADVLRKIPALTVDLDGNVQLRGNSNLKVLINGKPSAMMARNLADALRQMPAHLIKSVEVITNPGAKYDAEGAAGVINIITKKGLQGFNGTVTASGGNMNRSLGSRLSLRKKKIGLSLALSGYQYRNIRESEVVRSAFSNGSLVNTLTQNNEADNLGTGGNGELSFDFDPDSTTHLNFSANVWGGDFPSDETSHINLVDHTGQEIQRFRNVKHFSNPYGNGQLDLGYTKSLKKKDQEFSLLTQFSRMPDNYFYTTDRYILEEISYRDKSTNYSRNREYTVQADYTHPFTFNGRKDTTSLKLELGSKAIIRDIGSEFNVEQSLDGHSEMVPDPSQSNQFDYTQRVYSGYTSVRLNNQRKWGLNAGARIEHTEIKGNFVTSSTHINTQYNNLIPSITLSKGIKQQTLKASYTQRITRPLIWYLNPWINQSDPKNIYTGNPALKPEINHAIELGHSINGKKGFSLNTSLYWRSANNAIEYLTRVDATGVSISKPENIAQRKAYGININAAGQPNKNWNLSGGTDVRYVDLNSVALQQRNNGYMWSINTNTSYKLPKEFTIQAYASWYSGWISLQGSNSGSYWYGLSAKHAFWDKKATLTAGVNNPFQRGIWQKNQQSSASFQSESNYFFVNRSYRLTFEYRFGKVSADGGKEGKKIRNDDSGR